MLGLYQSYSNWLAAQKRNPNN